LKKLSAVVASDSDADIQSACCTDTSAAKCSDWINTCPAGHTKVGGNAAPANDGTPALDITADEFKSKCCTKTCSYAGGVLYADGNAICRDNGAASFFDTKKLAANIESDWEPDDDVRSTCCTATSAAKCSDWINTCPAGHTKVGNNTAPADSGSPALAITAAAFESKCCVKTCLSVAGAFYATGIAKCRKNSAASFFDLKKLSAVVASDSDADIQSACCTDTSAAKCSDWLKICPDGHTKVGGNAAPADQGTPALAITADEFKSKCCIVPMRCSDYSEETNGTISKATSFVVSLLLIVMYRMF